MVKRQFTESQIKAHVLDFLRRQERWGAHYFPIATMVNWISKGMKRNGKLVRKAIKELVKEGYITLHKRGDTVSLNPSLVREINEYIEKNLEG
ncbi:MAG: hypothetical protein H3Z53_07380 [archaeon]|nr:hypothetical protein [archaeon]